MYDVNYTSIIANNSDIEAADPDWPTKPCDNGWEFDFSVIPYSTIATEVSKNQPLGFFYTFYPFY